MKQGANDTQEVDDTPTKGLARALSVSPPVIFSPDGTRTWEVYVTPDFWTDHHGIVNLEQVWFCNVATQEQDHSWEMYRDFSGKPYWWHPQFSDFAVYMDFLESALNTR